MKSAFGAVPFAGSLLNEAIFDYRSRIKQNRLNDFTKLLSLFFTDNPDVELDGIKTEEFSDLFESVVRRVLQTKSKEKYIRFKNILVQQIQYPHKDIDNAETYLDLISTLDEMCIWILREHLSFFKAYEIIDPIRAKISAKVQSNQEEINKIYSVPQNEVLLNKAKKKLKSNQDKVERYNKQVIGIQEFRKSEFFGISPSEYLYYKQILYAKGLLIEKGAGSLGHESFRTMGITEFGKKFIEFMSVE